MPKSMHGQTRRAPSSPGSRPGAPGHSGRAWHAAAPADVLSALGADPERGLDPGAVAERGVRFGFNLLPPPRRRSAVRRLLSQFHHALIYLLLATAGLTLWLGEQVDAAVILVVVVLNAAIGYVQEGNAERALDAISAMLPANATALRGGRVLALPAAQLVPGDIVYLASGDQVPADLRLIAAHSLRIDEAVLTGESLPADKSIGALEESAPLAERRCMAYSGTIVRHGTAEGVVVATGRGTEIGQISAMLERIDPLATPLLRKISGLGRAIAAAVLVLAGALFAFGTLVAGQGAVTMFSAAVALAVASIPEGLPAVISITLAFGVQRMARRRAIIRHLPAVEALGAATVICTDKTGTLTRNEMVARRLVLPSVELEVGGEAYWPRGAFRVGGGEVAPADVPGLADLALGCLLCNDAMLHDKGDGWEMSGDPTEGALLSLAIKAGLDAPGERARFPRVGVIPFESEHGFMATLHAGPGARARIVLKGAPERVFPLCGEGGMALPARWERASGAMAEQGLRLIAVAVRAAAPEDAAFGFGQVEAGGFTLLGVVALDDPPRPEALAAVAACLRAGIRIKMITGDHASTARAIGEQLGFPRPVQALTGSQIDAMDDRALEQALAVTDVFARASPQHKLRLVQALQRAGEVVVMTGDGVNDAPALKCADVGVAMGRKGTAAARDAAEMVLADDNFATLAAAVEEGRVVYDNVRKTIVFTLPTNGGEAGMLLLAILFGWTLPITPVQILWVNLITEVTLSLALAFEKAEDSVMLRPPRPPAQALVTRFLVWRIAFVSLLMVGGCMGLYLWELQQGGSLAQARTAVVAGLVIGHVAYLFNTRHLHASSLSWEALTGNRVILLAVGAAAALQAALTYWGPAQTWFGTAALDGAAWARIGGFGLLLFLAVELEKRLRRRPRARAAGGTVAGARP